MSKLIHNHENLLEYRRSLRLNSTEAEALLWAHLRGGKLAGYKFRRQHSVGRYILDFYCTSERLAVELDGQGHFTDEGIEYDKERTDYLNSLNIRVIRFENKLVFENIERVLVDVVACFKPVT